MWGSKVLPITVSVGGLAAASANNIATSQTPTSGTALTLNGSLVSGGVATLDKPRQILLTFGNEATNRTAVFYGNNSDNNPIQETLTVVSGASGTVATTQSFSTVTKILPLGGGWTAAVTVGTNTVASSPWRMGDIYVDPGNWGFACIVTGTANYTVEVCYTDFQTPAANVIGSQAVGNPINWPTPFSHPTLQNLTISQDGSLSTPIFAWRLTLNSGTGSVTCTALQSGIRP